MVKCCIVICELSRLHALLIQCVIVPTHLQWSKDVANLYGNLLLIWNFRKITGNNHDMNPSQLKFINGEDRSHFTAFSDWGEWSIAITTLWSIADVLTNCQTNSHVCKYRRLRINPIYNSVNFPYKHHSPSLTGRYLIYLWSQRTISP